MIKKNTAPVMIAAPIRPTIAKVEPIAALFCRKEVLELFPVPAFPSAEEVSLGMPIVELKRRLDVESRLLG